MQEPEWGDSRQLGTPPPFREGAGGRSVRVPIGLHTGEAINEHDDFFGKNVILATRIANQARGGEILVSSVLKELTESSGRSGSTRGARSS